MASSAQVQTGVRGKVVAAWPVVGLLWIAYVINYTDRQAVFSIFPALRGELHFSNAQLGLIGSLFIWVYSLCMPFTGWLSDIWPRNRVIVASLVLWSAATLGTGLSHSVPAFLAWRCVVGVTESMYVPASVGLIAALHTGPTRSRALAAHITAQYAGIFAGGWYGGWAADHIGWRVGFWILAAAGVGYAAVLWRILGNAPKPPAPVTAAASESGAWSFLRSRCYIAMCVAFFAFCAMLWMLYGWLPDIIYDQYHLSMTESGFIATLYLQASSVAGVALGGTMADALVKRIRAARYYVAGTGLVLCAPFGYLVLETHSLLVLKIAVSAFGLTAGLMASNHFASTYDVIAQRSYGIAIGLLNMIGGLSGGLGVLAGGLLKASAGIATAMLWAAIATVVTGCALLITAALAFRGDRRRAGLNAV